MLRSVLFEQAAKRQVLSCMKIRQGELRKNGTDEMQQGSLKDATLKHCACSKLKKKSRLRGELQKRYIQ